MEKIKGLVANNVKGFIAGVIVTIAVGFMWGGWVTGGSARGMARDAAQDTADNLRAAYCAYMAKQTPGAIEAVTAIDRDYNRPSHVRKQEWAVFPGDSGELDHDVAELCAERIMES